MTLDWSLIASPIVISIMAIALLVPPLIAIVLRVRGAIWRFLGAILILLALTGPSLIEEKRTPLKTIVAVIADRSGSQEIGGRRAQELRRTRDRARLMREIRRRLRKGFRANRLVS